MVHLVVQYGAAFGRQDELVQSSYFLHVLFPGHASNPKNQFRQEKMKKVLFSCLSRFARSSAAPSRGDGVRGCWGDSTRSGRGRLRRTAQGELLARRRSPLTRNSRSSLLSSLAASLIFLRIKKYF